MGSLIVFDNITKTYNHGMVALDKVSFHVAPKEFVSLVGRSGAGKSTLLKLLIAEEAPSEGSVYFDGQDIGLMSHDKELPMLRRTIGTVFQDFKLL